MFWNSQVAAQDLDESNFTRFTKQQGLSNDVVSSMAQDSVGHIWISTFSGLNRFNGGNFVQFHNNNDSLSLPSEEITGMTWLDCHRLVAWANGLHIINTRTGETRNLFIPCEDKKLQYKFNWIMGVSSSPQGDIYILTRSGFYHFDKNYQLVFRYDAYSKNEENIKVFSFGRSMLRLDDHRLMILAVNGIWYYDTRKKQIKKAEPDDCPILASFLNYPDYNYGIYEVSQGAFIIANPISDSLTYVNVGSGIKTVTRLPFKNLGDEFNYRSEVVSISDSVLYFTGNESGFYKMTIDPGTGHISFYPHKYFPLYYCRHLMEDRDHVLWVATDRGLFRQNNTQLHIRQAEIPAWLEAKFPRIVIDDIYVTKDKIYVATRRNGGLLEFDKKKLEFLRRFSFEKFSKYANNILSIVSAGDSSLYIAGGSLFKVNLKNGNISEIGLDQWANGDWISDMVRDRANNLWIAAERMYKMDGVSQQISTIPYRIGKYERVEKGMVIQQDAEGNIWMAGHGLIRYNSTTNDFDRVVDSFPFIKMPDRQVNSFIADAKNNL